MCYLLPPLSADRCSLFFCESNVFSVAMCIFNYVIHTMISPTNTIDSFLTLARISLEYLHAAFRCLLHFVLTHFIQTRRRTAECQRRVYHTTIYPRETSCNKTTGNPHRIPMKEKLKTRGIANQKNKKESTLKEGNFYMKTNTVPATRNSDLTAGLGNRRIPFQHRKST